MSAPDTNIETQKSNHKPALLGIRGAVIFGAAMMVLLAIYVIGYGDEEDANAVTNTNGGEAGVIINSGG